MLSALYYYFLKLNEKKFYSIHLRCEIPVAKPLVVGLTSGNLAAAATKSLQLCLTLCDPIDGSPPGPSVHGIFQARVLAWGAIASSSQSLNPF